jgi:hypothetical protein
MTNLIKTTKPSGNDLDSLFYEIWMMNKVFNHMSAASPGVTKNAFLECFLLHLRNLVYFLQPPNPKYPDDLTYKDFQDKNNQDIGQIRHSITHDEVEAINKHLQHISKVRSQKKITWPSEPLLLELNRAIGAFIHQLSDANFPTKEKRTREDFLRLLSARTAGTRMAYLPVGLQMSTTVETTAIIPACPASKPPTDAEQT